MKFTTLHGNIVAVDHFLFNDPSEFHFMDKIAENVFCAMKNCDKMFILGGRLFTHRTASLIRHLFVYLIC